ncbi:1697_t:CDS:2 [Entrophospora sp. SA101]|nr:1697_t:CDS:2 [Entrophospora sp. SA101]CAJ0825232.1 7799_t:CDS:2 [Entrophospora sp. SA101]
MSQVQRNIPSFSTVTSSFKSYILSLPLLTTIIACISIIFYIIDATGSNIIYNALALEPESFFEGQIWRLFTYPLPHFSLGHILFNLLAFLPLSTTIEHTIGTLEYLYVLITIFTIMSGSFYLIGSLIFDYKSMMVGGLSTWVFGVVVWESRELAGKERDSSTLLSNSVTINNDSFGYISCILPSSGFFSQLENKTALSRLVNFRGFIKAEEGSRGGWWLPLWNEDTLEEPLESSNDEQNDDNNLASLNAEENNHSESHNLTTNSIFVVSSNSSTPEATSPLTTTTMTDPILNSSTTNVTLTSENNTKDVQLVAAE